MQKSAKKNSIHNNNVGSSNSKSLSVIIVIHNPTFELLDCLKAIQKQTLPKFSLIIVNNGGEKPEFLSKFRLIYLELEKNMGVSYARNFGAMHANTDIVAFLDDDGIPSEDWAQTIISCFSKNVMAVRGKIISKNSQNIFNKIAYHYDLGDEITSSIVNLEGNSAFNRKMFLTVGGFNVKIYGHEGEDLSNRLKRKYPTFKILYIPNLIIKHDFCDGYYHYFYKRFRQGLNKASVSNMKSPPPAKTSVPKVKTTGDFIIIFLLEFLGTRTETLGSFAKKTFYLPTKPRIKP